MSAASSGAPAAVGGRSLPPGLSWEPACTHARLKAAAVEPAACRFGLADVTAEDFRNGSYEVAHYAPAAYGQAFGPLSLGQVVRFCQEMSTRLQQYGRDGRVVFQYGPSPAERANCAMLLGGFLVLCKGWSASAVAEVLKSEARLVFPCSWAKPGKMQSPVLSVRDCWDGLELAGSWGWLRVGPWEVASSGDAGLEAQLVDLGVSQYRRLALQYDACWLVPAEIMVMADPMTTIKDPNPSTCPSFGPPAEAAAEDDEDLRPPSPGSTEFGDEFAVSHKGTMSLSLSCEEAAEPEAEHGHELAPDIQQLAPDIQHWNDRNSSLHSVCKDYQHAADFGPEEATRPKALDFVSLLLKHSVGLVVRANDSNEDGLVTIGGSYDPEAIRKHGIQHLDCFVKDVNGGIPPPPLIRSFLLEVDSLAPKAQTNSAPAIVVHCKGGFGRSVLFACLLVIHRYDVPGRAVLGWARLARPGAFTVPEQEHFLCRFGCREDLHRHVGLVGASPYRCCSVQ